MFRSKCRKITLILSLAYFYHHTPYYTSLLKKKEEWYHWKNMYLDFVIITKCGGRDPGIFRCLTPAEWLTELELCILFIGLPKGCSKNSHVDWGALQKLGCPDGRACVRQGYTQTFWCLFSEHVCFSTCWFENLKCINVKNKGQEY